MRDVSCMSKTITKAQNGALISLYGVEFLSGEYGNEATAKWMPPSPWCLIDERSPLRHFNGLAEDQWRTFSVSAEYAYYTCETPGQHKMSF